MVCTLHADLESRSELSLPDVGLDRYVRHKSTQLLMMAFAFDDGPVDIWEPHLGPMPARVLAALKNPSINKSAWNSQFERVVSKFILGIETPYEVWLDPQIHSRMMSMPGSLEDCCNIVGLKEGKLATKIKVGRGKNDQESLINFFCEPVHDGGGENMFGPTEAVFRDWSTHPEEWELFKAYCKRDVETEREIGRRLAKFYPMPDVERRGFHLDQKVNDLGIPCDLSLVDGAMKVAEQAKTELNAKLTALTALDNPNSRDQMLGWLRDRGYPFGSLGKPLVTRALESPDLSPEAREALTIRKESAKTSDSKLDAIAGSIGPDGRLRYQLLYLGAARTGRWAGQVSQPQNFPRPDKATEKNLTRALELLRLADYASIKAEFPSPINVVTSSLRSAFRASLGKKLVVCDLSTIETRGSCWVAEIWDLLKEIQNGKDPYLLFAAELYGESYESLLAAYLNGDPIAKEKRQNAKPAVLGCFYKLSGGEEVVNKDGDTIKTGLWGYAAAQGVSLTQDESHRAVRLFRKKYHKAVTCWDRVEEAAQKALYGVSTRVGPLKFEKVYNVLCVRLPSGRSLHYVNPKLERTTYNGYERENITYEGKDSRTKQWTKQTTHAGKIFENAIQALARDVLLDGLLKADEFGFPIVLHCHDEIVAEVPENSPLGLPDLKRIMETSPSWAPDLPLGAEGYESEVYRK